MRVILKTFINLKCSLAFVLRSKVIKEVFKFYVVVLCCMYVMCVCAFVRANVRMYEG